MIRRSSSVFRVSFLFLALFSCANLVHARTAIESLSQVENLFMQGKYDRVISEANKLIDAGAHGREELFYLKGLSQIQLKRFTDSRETFDYMVKRYPRGKRAFDGYIGIGDSYFSQAKYSEAITGYNSALNNYPDHKNAPIAYYKIGTSYQKMGLADKAKEYFEKVRRNSPLSFESRIVPDIGAAKAVSPISEPVQPTEIPQIDAGDYYYIQAGYFKNKDNAQKLTSKLRQRGYDSYMSTQDIKAGLYYYRVKIGRFKSKTEAEEMARKLKADGYKTKICR